MKIGYLIKEKRIEKKIKQHELADNICTQAMISKIERGLLNPSHKLLIKIAAKLETPVAYFYGESLNGRNQYEKELTNLVDQMRSLLNKGEYKTVATQLEANSDSIDKNKNLYLDINLKWIKSILLYFLDSQTEKSITLLIEIQEVAEKIDLALSLDIISTLGIIYYQEGYYDKADRYFEECFQYLNKISSFETKARLLYNYALNLDSLNKEKEALEVALQGIELLISNQSLYMLGYFYYLKGFLLKKIGPKEYSIEAFEEAIFVFKILDYKKMLTMARIELKEVRENEDEID